MFEVGRCRSCGCERLERVGECAPFPEQLAVSVAGAAVLPGSLFRCPECGLGQRQPGISEADLPELYRETRTDVMDYRAEDNRAWTEARSFLLQAWSANEVRHVLDVGCHTGLFLGCLPPAWRRYGIEGAAAPSAHAREHHGVEIIAERIEDVSEQWIGRFDAVTDRKSTRLNSSHSAKSRMPSSA